MNRTPMRVAVPPKKNAWPMRLAVVLVLAAVMALVWWSVNQRLLPVLHQGQQTAQEVSTLANEVQQLEAQWNPDDITNTEGLFQDSKQSLLTSDEDRLALSRTLQEEAEALNFFADVKLGQVQPFPTAGYKLSLLLTTINLQTAPGNSLTNTPYARLMHFTRLLTQIKPRVDLLDLSVAGNSNSVQQAQAVLQFWSEEKEEAAP